MRVENSFEKKLILIRLQETLSHNSSKRFGSLMRKRLFFKAIHKFCSANQIFKNEVYTGSFHRSICCGTLAKKAVTLKTLTLKLFRIYFTVVISVVRIRSFQLAWKVLKAYASSTY